MNTLAIILFATIAISATVGHPAEKHEEKHEEKHHVPGYHFEYGVHDPHTKDHKSQHEHRDHDKVKGGYMLHEPDGTKRIVEYTSDKKEGFQAVVKREGHAKHPGHDHKSEGGKSYVGVTHWGHGSGR